MTYDVENSFRLAQGRLGNDSRKGNIVDTVINLTLPNDGGLRLVAPIGGPDTTAPVRLFAGNATGQRSVLVEVTIIPGGRAPASIRWVDARGIEAASWSAEDAALEAEDILTLADEANAMRP